MTFKKNPFRNSYWLSKDLLAGELPTGSDPQFTIYKLESLLDAGIRTFIDLRKEKHPEYQRLLKELSQKHNIETTFCKFPIRDMDVPSVKMMKDILDVIEESLSRNKPVYFHCMAGLGRTGLVSCCWLKRHSDKDGREILKMLQQIRLEQNHLIHWDSPQSAEQYEMVLRWKYGE